MCTSVFNRDRTFYSTQNKDTSGMLENNLEEGKKKDKNTYITRETNKH